MASDARTRRSRLSKARLSMSRTLALELSALDMVGALT